MNPNPPSEHKADAQGLPPPADEPVILPARSYFMVCLLISVLIALVTLQTGVPGWLLPAEAGMMVVLLFGLGSFRYQFTKNTLALGWLMPVMATSLLELYQQGRITMVGWRELGTVLLALPGLIHADTVLFMIGLSFFVAVLTQSRLLETVARRALWMLERTTWLRPRLFWAILPITAIVAVASGILDGVSMVGLLLRTLAVLLAAAGCATADSRRTLALSCIVTTVCGMYLAYGEPPNLIMKANLRGPDGSFLLTDAYFLTWCAPLAVLALIVIAATYWRLLSAYEVRYSELDAIERNLANIRFLQSRDRGKAETEQELVLRLAETLGPYYAPVQHRMQDKDSLGAALVTAEVPRPLRLSLLREYVGENRAEALDDYFVTSDQAGREAADRSFYLTLKPEAEQRVVVRRYALVGLAAFVLMLLAHSQWHSIPLFSAPLVGGLIAWQGLRPFEQIRKLATHDGWHEVQEYLFLVPIFLSISLIAQAGGFSSVEALFLSAAQDGGALGLALSQFAASAVLSAFLDNNVVADIGSRCLGGLERSALYLSATSQIAGYAVGGCATHVGSAQSVLCFAFIGKSIAPGYRPLDWVKDVGGPLLLLFCVLAIGLSIQALVWGS